MCSLATITMTDTMEKPINSADTSVFDAQFHGTARHAAPDCFPTRKGSSTTRETSLEESQGSLASLIPVRIATFNRRQLTQTFTPAWFVSVMGTSISSSCIFALGTTMLDYPAVRIIAFVYLGFAIFLSFAVTLLFFLRLAFDFRQFSALLRDPRHIVFLGCYPMGLWGICNTVYAAAHYYGVGSHSLPHWDNFCYAMAILNAILSISCTLICTYAIVAGGGTDIRRLNAQLLLPVVPLVVTASEGTVVLPTVPQHMQYSHMVLCFVEFALGEVLVQAILVLYLARLFRDGPLDKAAFFSGFLPLGPLGQGAFGIFRLGRFADTFFRSRDQADVGTICFVCSLFISMVLLSYGVFWFFHAVVCIVSCGRQSFGKGWWAGTFPLGTVTMALLEFGEVFDSVAAKVLGIIFLLGTILLTLACLIGTFTVEVPLLHRKRPRKVVADVEMLAV